MATQELNDNHTNSTPASCKDFPTIQMTYLGGGHQSAAMLATQGSYLVYLAHQAGSDGCDVVGMSTRRLHRSIGGKLINQVFSVKRHLLELSKTQSVHFTDNFLLLCFLQHCNDVFHLGDQLLDLLVFVNATAVLPLRDGMLQPSSGEDQNSLILPLKRHLSLSLSLSLRVSLLRWWMDHSEEQSKAGVLRERDGTSLINAAKGAPVSVLNGGLCVEAPVEELDS
ncbi:hypothetical protein Taro_050000 [Colocasia esculenta]|uniref:Uncharacterized protein n=1 Tax=Colocasia esculenta TaxID=4460 RepID=A0A843XCL3_COLES|nr:hypothetical protein [Colocasia esculenta]